MTPEDRYHFEPLLMSVESAIGRGESVGQYHHSEVLRLLRAALAAAEAAPLDAPSGGSPYVTRLTNSLSYHLAAEATPRTSLERQVDRYCPRCRARIGAEAAPLDVERLARAVQAAMTDTGKAVDYRPLAEDIAREYAALRSPDTEVDRWAAKRDAMFPRSPDTETAGEAG